MTAGLNFFAPNLKRESYLDRSDLLDAFGDKKPRQGFKDGV